MSKSFPDSPEIRREVVQCHLKRLRKDKTLRHKILAVRQYAIDSSIFHPEQPYTSILRNRLSEDYEVTGLNRLELLNLVVGAGYIESHTSDPNKLKLSVMEELEALHAPSDYEYWSRKGAILYNKEYLFLSVRCYDQAIRINASEPVAWRKKGRNLLHLGTFTTSIETPDCEKTGRPLWYNLRKLEWCLVEALSCFNRAIQLDYRNSETYVLKAECLVELGRPEEDLRKMDEGVKCLKEALKIDPSDTRANHLFKLWG